jgi:hypothetical protein
MSSALKTAIGNSLRSATAPFLRVLPLRQWPGLTGRLHELSVPAAVRPHPQPEPYGAANINILLKFLDRTGHLNGAIAECGVYRGATLVTMAVYLAQSGSKRTLWGMDSFEGFQHTIVNDEEGSLPDQTRTPTGFSDTSLGRVQTKLNRFGLNNVKLVPGFFENTLKTLPEQSYSLVHLDCDTYVAYKECLEYFYPRVQVGGIIAFDEYNDPSWPGCNKAIDEFLSGRPERLEEVVQDNYIKYAIIKKQFATSTAI